MADTNANIRHIYVVNNTKKDIRNITVNITELNTGLTGMFFGVVNVVKDGWNIFTKYGWETSDSVDMIKDVDCNLTEYQEKGYVLN